MLNYTQIIAQMLCPLIVLETLGNARILNINCAINADISQSILHRSCQKHLICLFIGHVAALQLLPNTKNIKHIAYISIFLRGMEEMDEIHAAEHSGGNPCGKRLVSLQ